MLMLLFRVGEEPWAIAASEVHEVVPLVALQPIEPLSASTTSTSLAGTMRYRGATIPVVDVSALVRKQAAKQALDTRIAIVTLKANGIGCRRLGLVLSQMSEAVQLNPVTTVPITNRYVHSIWQAIAGKEIVNRLAIEPIGASAYPSSANPVTEEDWPASQLETVPQTRSNANGHFARRT